MPADSLASALLRALRRGAVEVRALTLSRRRTIVTARLANDAGWCTIVVAGHAEASADGAARRAFRGLATRLAAGKVMKLPAPHAAVRHGPVVSVEVVGDDDNAKLLVVEKSGRVALWDQEASWTLVGSVELAGLKDALSDESKTANGDVGVRGATLACDGRKLVWIHGMGVSCRGVGLTPDRRLVVGLESRLADAHFHRVVPADEATVWLVGGSTVLVAAPVTGTAPPRVIAQFDDEVHIARCGERLLAHHKKEFVAWSPDGSRAVIGGTAEPPPGSKLVDVTASTDFAVLLFEGGSASLRVYDLANAADLVFVATAAEHLNGYHALCDDPRGSGSRYAKNGMCSRFQPWLAPPSQDEEESWSVGVLDRKLGRLSSWTVARPPPPPPVRVVTNFSDDEPLRGVDGPTPRQTGEDGRRNLAEALREGNELAHRCVYPRRSNARSQAPAVMPRQRAAALAAALDLPREALSNPAVFTSMLFLCRTDRTDPCYGCFELLCHLHLSLEPAALPNFV